MICFHKSRILSNAVPLGFCFGGFSSTAGYDPGNEAQLAPSRFAPFGGSTSKGFHSFLFEWLEKVSQPSLAEPFGSDSGRHRISSRLLLLSSRASPHRLPIPWSVSKAVTFVTRALYASAHVSDQFFACFIFPRIKIRRLRRLLLFRKGKASVFK